MFTRLRCLNFWKNRRADDISRVSAVKGAEGVIELITEKYGWAWVNKDDPKIFIPWLFRTWFAQIEIVVAYLAIILVLTKRKDVK